MIKQIYEKKENEYRFGKLCIEYRLRLRQA